MMTAASQTPRDRMGSALAALLMQAALASLFIWGMGSDARRAMIEPLHLFNVLPPPPEPEPVVQHPPPRVASDTHRRRFAPGEEGGASAPNLRSQATPVVVPTPAVPLPVPSPVVAAPVAGKGSDSSQGAADVRGPGTGSGGRGNGSGSGLGGGGRGGGGYGDYSPPRRIRGDLRDSDYPRELGAAGVGGTVGVLYTVLANGRVTDCQIEHSSGNATLDAMTCRLIERRFVFEPSRDERGRPVDSHIVENHSWVVDDLPEEPRRTIRRRRLF